MVGICSYGAYIPYYRLSLKEIARAWGGYPMPGEKAVANFDEDAITLATEAGIACLKGFDRSEIDGISFASTTSPYREKQAAAIAGTALDLRKNAFASDFGNSLRAGTCALRSALDAVKAGSAKKVLVTAADCRIGIPNSPLEQNLGDGAGAVLLGDEKVAATIEGIYSLHDDVEDVWRTQKDEFVQMWEERFVITQGYQRVVKEAVSAALKSFNLEPKDFAKVVLYGPDARNHTALARSLGFDLRSQVQNGFFNSVGSTGAAQPLMLLVAALEKSKPGDLILLASYGDGSDVFVFKVTEEIKNLKDRRGMAHYLASKKMIANYETYAKFRGLISILPASRPPDVSYAPVNLRDRNSVEKFHAGKCNKCGTVQFPIDRICQKCFSKDEYQEVRLSDKIGKIFTFNKDQLAASIHPPTVMVTIDFEGGGRISAVGMTDRDPDNVYVGMEVEMTFRRMHDAAGIHNYFWKPRPIR